MADTNNGPWWMLGHGGAKKAGKEMLESKDKTDKAIKAQTGEDDTPPPPKQDPAKGIDKGELGKKYSDSFHF